MIPLTIAKDGHGSWHSRGDINSRPLISSLIAWERKSGIQLDRSRVIGGVESLLDGVIYIANL